MKKKKKEEKKGERVITKQELILVIVRTIIKAFCNNSRTHRLGDAKLWYMALVA